MGKASPYDRATPEELFARFGASGDAAALGALFDRLAPELFRVALSLTPDAAAADDADLHECRAGVVGTLTTRSWRSRAHAAKWRNCSRPGPTPTSRMGTPTWSSRKRM